MKKRLLSIFLSLSMLFSVVTIPMVAEAAANSVMLNVDVSKVSANNYQITFDIAPAVGTDGMQYCFAVFTQKFVDDQLENGADDFINTEDWKPNIQDTIDNMDISGINGPIFVKQQMTDSTVTTIPFTIQSDVYNTSGTTLYVVYNSPNKSTAQSMVSIPIDKNGNIDDGKTEITLTAPAKITYDGSAHPQTDVTISGVPLGTTLSVGTDYTVALKDMSISEVKNARDYVYVVTLSDEAFSKTGKKVKFVNSAGEASKTAEFTFTIEKAELGVDWSKALTVSDKTFDGNKTISVTGNEPTVTGVQAGDTANDIAEFTYEWKTATAGTKNVVATLKLKTAGNTNYKLPSAATHEYTVTQTINPKQIDVTTLGYPAFSKVFDKTKAAVLGTITIPTGLVDNFKNVTIKNTAAAEYDSPDVGSNKTVAIKNIELDGTDKINYTLSANTHNVTTGVITAANSTLSTPAQKNVMAGEEVVFANMADKATVTGVGGEDVSDQFTIKYKVNGAVVTSFTPSAAGETEVTVEAVCDNQNYNNPSSVKFKIKATDKKPAVGTVTITADPSGALEIDGTTTLTATVNITDPAGVTEDKMAYQWYKNGTAIDGATSKTYDVPTADTAAAGDIKYRCDVTVTLSEPGYETTTILQSAEHTVTVKAPAATEAPTATPTAAPTDAPTAAPTGTPKPTSKPSSGGGGGGGSSVSISFKNANETGYVGDTLKLEPTIKGSTKTPTWTSADESIATVDENGVVTMIKEGTVKITAKVGTNTKSVTVKVLPRPSATATPAPTAKPDTNAHKAYIYGYEDGDFRAERGITRAETAAIFARALTAYTEGDYENTMLDMDGTEWFANNVNYLVGQNVITGYEDGTFRPYENITRQEFATMISRLGEVLEAGDMSFTDVSAENEWGVDYIYTAYVNGWVSGYEDGTFRPYNSITRAEAVRIVNAYLKRAVDSEGLAGVNYTSFPDVATSHWAYFDIIEAANDHNFEKDTNPEKWVD